MGKRIRAVLIFILFIAFILLMEYLLMGSPLVMYNGAKLSHVAGAVPEDTESVQLNEIVPFGWDKVYTIEPCTSREEIVETIGFKSRNIEENMVSEDMLHLIFVYGDAVVATVMDRPEKLGYDLELPPVVSFEEDAALSVEQSGDITVFRYAE